MLQKCVIVLQKSVPVLQKSVPVLQKSVTVLQKSVTVYVGRTLSVSSAVTLSPCLAVTDMPFVLI